MQRFMSPRHRMHVVALFVSRYIGSFRNSATLTNKVSSLHHNFFIYDLFMSCIHNFFIYDLFMHTKLFHLWFIHAYVTFSSMIYSCIHNFCIHVGKESFKYTYLFHQCGQIYHTLGSFRTMLIVDIHMLCDSLETKI